MEIYMLYEACQVSGDQSVRDRNLSTVCLIGIAETSTRLHASAAVALYGQGSIDQSCESTPGTNLTLRVRVSRSVVKLT